MGWGWNRLIWKWMFHRHPLSFYRRSFATCSFCRALEDDFVGQGFSGIFWWQRNLEVHQKAQSHGVRWGPHSYQTHCLPVINVVFLLSFISLFILFFLHFFVLVFSNLYIHLSWVCCEECFSFFVLAVIPWRLDRWQLKTLCAQAHATCEISTRAFGG